MGDSAGTKMILTCSCPHRAGQHPSMGEAARSHHWGLRPFQSAQVGSGMRIPTFPTPLSWQAPIDPLQHPTTTTGQKISQPAIRRSFPPPGTWLSLRSCSPGTRLSLINCPLIRYLPQSLECKQWCVPPLPALCECTGVSKQLRTVPATARVLPIAPAAAVATAGGTGSTCAMAQHEPGTSQPGWQQQLHPKILISMGKGVQPARSQAGKPAHPDQGKRICRETLTLKTLRSAGDSTCTACFQPCPVLTTLSSLPAPWPLTQMRPSRLPIYHAAGLPSMLAASPPSWLIASSRQDLGSSGQGATSSACLHTHPASQ